MNITGFNWSNSEKKIARRAFDEALETALARALADFKQKAAAAATAADMWEIEEELRRQRHHIDDLFDYRYSQLLFVFARLIREGLLDQSRLAGLSEDKLQAIASSLALFRR
jgi:glycyl-tRNA synthetase beta subunit